LQDANKSAEFPLCSFKRIPRSRDCTATRKRHHHPGTLTSLRSDRMSLPPCETSHCTTLTSPEAHDSNRALLSCCHRATRNPIRLARPTHSNKHGTHGGTEARTYNVALHASVATSL
jgi:hypothetical protein